MEQVERHLISAKEAAQWLGVPVTTLYGWAWTGKIPHFRVHKRVLFGRADLLRWLEGHHRSPNGASWPLAPDPAVAHEAASGGGVAPLRPMGESSAATESSFWGAC